MKKNTIRKPGILLVLCIVLLTSACSKNIQTNTYVKGFKNLSEKSIYSDNIVKTIGELASEKFEGRLAGSNGNKLAEDYIADYFKKIGLEMPQSLGSYRQTYSQTVMIKNGAPVLQILDKKGKVIKDFIYPDNFINSGAIASTSIKGEASAEGLVIGSRDDLNNKESLKGKILIINKDIRSQIGNNTSLMTMVKGSGALGLVMEIDITSPSNPYKHLPISPYALHKSLYDNEKGPLVVSVESNTFKEISNSAKQGELIKIKEDYESKEVQVSNIIGVIPGSDSKLKDEYIIISGHLDHVGDNKNGTINGGALDNASGVSTLMEVARVMKESKTPPKKTIIFIAFNGEEEGLFGAFYYAEHPVFTMNKDNTVVINIDMVGSKAVMPLTLGNYNATETKLREDLIKYSQDLNIDSTKAVEDASDHTPFAQRNIQALTLINLDIENPAYHTPKDTLENTISQDRIGQVAKLVLYYLDKNAYN